MKEYAMQAFIRFAQMEHQGVSVLKAEHQHEIEIPKLPEKVEILAGSRQLFCNTFCAFYKQENDLSEAEHRSKSAKKLCGLIIISLVFIAVEIVGGIKANSLAVLTDAAHLLSDVFGFSISLFALWASGWEATPLQSFGFNRLEVLGALLSVQLIWLISGVLIYEAVDRILHKVTAVNGKLMFAVAAIGFFINLITIAWLGHNHTHHVCSDSDHHCHKEEEPTANEEERANLVLGSPEKNRPLNINVQGAYLHVMADLIQSIGVMIAGAIIWAKPDWLVVDLICTLICSVFVVCTTISMLRNVFGILMERTPTEIDLARLESGLRQIEGVGDIQDLHVWSITVGKVVLACHVRAKPRASSSEILHDIRDYCERSHRIHHVTIQIEEE